MKQKKRRGNLLIFTLIHLCCNAIYTVFVYSLRRAIAFAEKSEAEKKKEQDKQDKLLAEMQAEDKQLFKKKGFRFW